MTRTRSTVRLAAVAAVSILVMAATIFVVIQVAQSGQVRVPQGRTIRGDYRATGGTIDVVGSVQGNVSARAGYVYVLGPVGGDVSVVSGLAELRGHIAGSLRIVAPVASIYGVVDGDVEFFGGQLRLMEGSVIRGNVIVHGANLLIVATAQVDGDLRGQIADLVIEGHVGGHVVPIARTVALEDSAEVDGDLSYESRETATIAPGARVRGISERRDPASRVPLGSLLFWHSAAIVRFAMMIMVGILLGMVMPRQLGEIAAVARAEPVLTVVTGLGVWMMVPLALIVSGLFVVTLPIVGLLTGVFALLTYCSMTVVGLAVGQGLLHLGAPKGARAPNLVAMTLGVAGIAVARLTPVPYLDILISALVAVFGMGALGLHGWVGCNGPRTTVHSPQSVWLGVLAGAASIALGVAAVGIAVGGAAMVIATTSRFAVFTWEIAPRHLGVATLMLAAGSLGLMATVLRMAHRSIPIRGA